MRLWKRLSEAIGTFGENLSEAIGAPGASFLFPPGRADIKRNSVTEADLPSDFSGCAKRNKTGDKTETPNAMRVLQSAALTTKWEAFTGFFGGKRVGLVES